MNLRDRYITDLWFNTIMGDKMWFWDVLLNHQMLYKVMATHVCCGFSLCYIKHVRYRQHGTFPNALMNLNHFFLGYWPLRHLYS